MKAKIFIILLMLAAGFLNLSAQDEPAMTMAPTFNVISSDTDRMIMSLECSDADATIYYTLDGSIPTHSSTVYSDFVKISRNLTVKAIAWTEAGGDSEISVYDIEYLETPMPEFFQDLNYVRITNRLEDTTTRYTLDETDPRTSATAITYNGNPILPTCDCTIMAYSFKEGLNNSPVNVWTFFYSRTQIPNINIETDFVIIDCPDAGATIYYTIDGSSPTHDSSIYTAPFKLEHNMNVKAVAWTEWGGDSEVNTYEVNWFYVPEPNLEQAGDKYIFTNQMEGASTKYTLDGTNPKTNPAAIVFDGNPFGISQNVTVYAYSYKENFTDSQVVEFSLTAKCAAPAVSDYDGHTVTLSCPEPGATIYYYDNRSGNWKEYTEPFALNSINQFEFYAVVEGSGIGESDHVHYEPEYYSDSESVQLRKSGLVGKAMAWQPDFDSESFKVETYDSQWQPFALEDSDFEYLRGLKSIMHLDLTQTANEKLPSRAFAYMNIRTLILPETLTGFGQNVFSGCDNLYNIEFLSDVRMPADLFDGKTTNANMMLYVRKKENTESLPAGSFKAIVKYGDSYRTEFLALDDNAPYYCFKDFFAKEISYTREFSRTTPLGGCGGWEGMALPFNVESIRYGEKNLTPFAFGPSDDSLNFWLQTYDQNIWQNGSYIFTDKAYLIAMPNNDAYFAEDNIAGKVTFSASNQYIYPSFFDPNSNSQLKANFIQMKASDDIMVLNDETYVADGKTFEPGSVFVAGLRAPRPFEAYLENVSGVRYVKVEGSTSADGISMLQGFHVWTEGNDICISSSINAHIRILDTLGRIIKSVEVISGNTERVQGLTQGIYIVGNKKIALR